ncbi:MAG: hypothetical protein Q9205_006144 [Flavoplaca limonia]
MSKVAAQIYKYSALPSSHSIRLIQLKPGVTNIWSDITLSLRITSLNEAVEYDALSYTWGDPLPPFSRKDRSNWGMDAVRRYPINIDGYLLEVTANLIDALHALADTGTRKSAMKSQYIWIDSICINQEDPLERAAQVSIMGSIYEAAQNVVIWLGGEDEFTNDALAAMKALSVIPRERHPEVKLADWYNQGTVLRRLGVQTNITPYMWLGLVAFLNRPWFSRVWVVQEVSLARDAVVVQTKDTSLVNVVKCYQFPNGYHLARSDLDELRTNVSIGMAAVYLESTRAGIASVGHKAWFYYLLQAHRHCLASDPRDKIYALLGIAWKERPPFSTHPGAIVPDYENSVREGYTNVAKTMLLSRKDLHYLSHVQDASFTAIDELPSWVPDYSVELRPVPLSMRGAPSWKASGGLSWNHQLGYQEPGSLNVLGFRLDTIVDAVREKPNPNDFQESEMTDAYWINVFELTRALNDIYPGQRPWQGVLELEPEGSPFSFENFEDLFIAPIERQASPRPDIGYRDLFSDFERELRYSGNARCLFRTARGYLGIGAQPLQTDDEIWILGGADTPVILRKPVYGSYRLIGETYVHGIMHGEAIRSITQEQMQQISLQ